MFWLIQAINLQKQKRLPHNSLQRYCDFADYIDFFCRSLFLAMILHSMELFLAFEIITVENFQQRSIKLVHLKSTVKITVKKKENYKFISFHFK